MKNLILTILIFINLSLVFAQENKFGVSAYDGFIVGGYVDKGMFLNFVGPNVSYTNNNSKISLGVLPSLRFKEDQGATKNALITPSLGFGLTYFYKKFAFQLPFYYNGKTAAADGQWQVGFGIGFKLSALNKK
jgi:hypothetical protein